MKINWGVIGCGGIAFRRTIPGLVLSENSNLVAVMDTNFDAAKTVQKEFDAKYAFDNVEDLLAVDEIDAVYIATPVFCHKDQVMKAAAAKKHILLEKPMGLTSADGEEMDAYCKARGVLLGVGFMMRFHAVHVEIKKLIDSGKIGTVVSAYAKFNCESPVSPIKWRQTKAFSAGGTMMDMGIHCIDLLTYLTGLKVTEVTGICGNQIFKYPDTEDAGTGIFKMDNGALFTVEANFNLSDELGGCRFEIYGTDGTIVAERTIGQLEVGEVKYILRSELERGWQTLPYEAGNMYTKETELFARAILDGTQAPVPALEAVTDQKVVEAVYESYESKKHIKM